jgi:hypothetical protein
MEIPEVGVSYDLVFSEADRNCTKWSDSAANGSFKFGKEQAEKVCKRLQVRGAVFGIKNVAGRPGEGVDQTFRTGRLFDDSELTFWRVVTATEARGKATEQPSVLLVENGGVQQVSTPTRQE